MRRVVIAREGSALSGLELDQVAVDLAKRNRQRLPLRSRLDQRADVFEQALAKLAVVRVDLPRSLGRDDDERVLGLGPLQQLVDRRVGDPLGCGRSSRHSAFSSLSSDWGVMPQT